MITDEIREMYTKRLREHIDAVREAGLRIGVRDDLLAIHDESKWGALEFNAYAKHFCGGGAPEEFSVAWLHHIHNNQHHWQHWIFPDNFTPKGSAVVENGVVEMPRHYALEMVADWMGASKAYTGSWDMTDWFCKNAPHIRLHSKTKMYVVEILHDSNMSDVIHPDVVWEGAFSSE